MRLYDSFRQQLRKERERVGALVGKIKGWIQGKSLDECVFCKNQVEYLKLFDITDGEYKGKHTCGPCARERGYTGI